MADVNRGNRPLSPHLQVYRPQITSASSIFVRITGIGILGLSVFVVLWLLLASGPEAGFAGYDKFLRGFLGTLLMLGGAWALFYHMLGRLRHLVWDLGYFVELEISKLMGKAMFLVATLLALFFVIVL